jgi:uncharacterized membrane-anchored protein
MKRYIVLAALLLGASSFAVAQDSAAEDVSLTAEEQALANKIEALTPETGLIALKGAPVSLDVTADYAFYDKSETRTVLEDLWGNPPDDTVLGMLFPMAGDEGEQENWSVVFTYEKTGYVTDEDAATTDFDEILRDLKKQTKESNRYRKQEGYPTVELAGWAASPRYDPGVNGIFWAKDLIFEGEPEHTLNYDMRLLGRRGVLSMNFIATLDDIESIEAAAPELLRMAAFDAGARYADYQEGDKKAGYGVAALVAGTAGMAVAKKAGFLGVILIALKKFWFLGFAAIAALGGYFKRMFGGRE